MKSMKRPFLYVLLSLTTLAFFACEDPEPEPPAPSNIALTASTTSYSVVRGNSVDISMTGTAEKGIMGLSVSVNGGGVEEISVNNGATSQDFTYAYELSGNAILNTNTDLVFTLTDADNQTKELTIVVTAGALLPNPPDSYVFMRDGNSTVSYSGQTDRLNMVAEIKANILLEGDKGNVVSEQMLLDAFENTNGDGNGFFSFSSTKQLKSKTFQVDLDDRLFENLFSGVAAASLAGSQGTLAADGQPGLITREDKGSTILVDENGREFTQLIEKGLMGAVFFNQIFNVYLTEARIGADVENFTVDEGKNYTAMEHHWDEAFGYFAPPLDFTSPWPDARKSELRFWSNYSNTVDNVNNGMLGTNKILMDAYTIGRTAIVNNDRDGIDAQRNLLYENLELVTAGTAVHYINLSLKFLNENKPGELFHVLSEVWTFVNAIKYSPNRKLDFAKIEEIKGTDLGADGNFWNVTAAGLNKAKTTLVTTYPKLDPVKDDL